MRKLLLTACFSCFLISTASNPMKDVVIEGQIVNYSDKSAWTITAIACNPWSDTDGRNAVVIDSAGYFKTFINIPFGHNFTIYYDGNYLCQYAEPGDSIYMIINADNIKAGATYSGTRAKLNNEYGKAYAKLFNTFFSEEPPAGHMDKDEYLKVFKGIQSKNLANIKAYVDSVGMGSDSRVLLEQSALFSLANGALEHEDETPEKVLAVFDDPIFGLDDEENLKEMMFPIHLNAYLWRLKDVVKPDSSLQMVEAIVARHPKSLNRDIMLAMYLKDINNEKVLPQLPRDIFYDEGICELVYDQADDCKPLPGMNDAIGSIYQWTADGATVSKYSNLTELLENEYAGKIVYLDFWATWCGPCLVANKALPEVADFFKDKDIVFVSVALRSDFGRWKKHAAARLANCKDYFIQSEDDAQLIMSRYNVNAFPRFRIIGKDSKIIDSDPPRPTCPQIYDTLTEILK